jgi:hypothetical protein
MVGDYHQWPKSGTPHQKIDAWVRSDNGLPITMRVEFWQPQPGGLHMKMNTVLLEHVLTTHYSTIARASDSDAAAAHAFSMRIPARTPVSADLHPLPVARAAAVAGYPLWWLGPSWNRPGGVSGPSLAADSAGFHFRDGPPATNPANSLSVFAGGPAWELHVDRHGGPRFSLVYGRLLGPRGSFAGLQVTSYPHFALGDWPTWGEAYRATAVLGHAALLGESKVGTYHDLLIDAGSSTIRVQSWGMPIAALMATAKQLQRLR